jgi:hypothetical protein
VKKNTIISIFVLVFSSGLFALPAHQVIFRVSIADALQEKFQEDGLKNESNNAE